MSDHDDLRDWDAAYLLGSLSTDDRRQYERHLAHCTVCSASVAELTGLPGLLGRVPAAEAEATLDQEPTSVPDLLPKLVGHVARRHRQLRRWVLTATIAGIAAVLATGIVVAPGLTTSFTSPQATALQLQPVGQAPLEASIRLLEEQWGTRIEMKCRYDAVDAYSLPADYAMYVTDDAGEDFRVATWTASPGATATPSGSTSLTVAQIRSVEVRSATDGTVLMRGSP
ncbi:MAG: zf-HC2 domain-containing protein [Homoserinimonas sp.]